MKKLYFFTLFLVLLLTLNLGMVNAMDIDNTISYDKITDKITFKNKIFLETVAEATLQENLCNDNRYCHAIKEIKLYKSAVLIEDFKTLRIDDGSWDEQNIRWHKLYYWGDISEHEVKCTDLKTITYENGSSFTPQNCIEVNSGYHKGWVEFQEGDVFDAGTYLVKTSGEIRPGRVYDWQVKINADWTTPWATWGNITAGDDAEVTLNSPANNSESLTSSITFNASANVTGGASLVNMSLFTNESGTWEAKNTTIVSSGASIQTDRLVSYYKLEETSGLVLDYMGLNNGTNEGDGVVRGVSGKIGFAFNNSNNTARINTSFNPDPDNYSISLWVNPAGVNNNNRLVAFGDPNFVGIWMDTSNTLRFFTADGQDLDGTTVLAPNVWTHVVVTYNGTHGAIYVNGTADATASMSAMAGNIGNMTLFAKQSGGNYDGGFLGKLDEIAYYNVSLSQANITALYNSHDGARPFATTDSVETWIRTLTDTTLWNVQGCDSDGDCGFAPANFTVGFDTSSPTITIVNGNGTQDYGVLTTNHTVNYTITDSNLDVAWIEYNGTNTTISTTYNSTNFTLQDEVFNATIWANDSVGNLNKNSFNWTYKVFQNNFSFSNSTVSGSQEDFTLNVTLGSGYDLTTASLSYNSVNVSPSIFSSGQIRIISVEDYEIPLFIIDTNVTMYFNLLLDDSTAIQTTEENQTVSAVFLDNCSTYTNPLFNISLYDEEEKTSLNGTIEFNYHLLNKPSFTEIGTINLSAVNTSDLQICSEINLTGGSYAQSIEIRYSSNGYEPEFYNIQRADFEEGGSLINLYDLNTSQSTRFKITYQDSNFVFVSGAIIQLQRKYIDENQYEVVEAPITSEDGTAILHIDLDTISYKVTVVKDGELLDVFSNIVFECASELTGECEQKLLGEIDPSNEIPLDTGRDFAYTITEANDTIDVIFSIPSGSPSSVNVQLSQVDQFGDSTLCNQTVLSSGGSIECGYNDTIGDSYIELRINKDDNPMAYKTYVVVESGGIDFLNNNYIIVLILLLSLVGMAIASPEFMVVNGVVTMVIAGSLWLLNGLNFVTGFGGLLWLMIAGMILIFKMSKQEDR